MMIVSPRSTASSRSEKCRDASVAVMVFTSLLYLIIRFTGRGKLPCGSTEQAGLARPGLVEGYGLPSVSVSIRIDLTVYSKRNLCFYRTSDAITWEAVYD
jgi:hypothetical protein